MGTVNNGQQKLSYDYRERGTAELFNKINYKIHSKGIYEGGTFTKVSDSSLNISPFICVYDDDVNKLSVRIETTEDALVEGISSSNPWIVGRFTWLNTENNFMDFLALDQGDILNSDIIFGYVDYEGSTMTNDFDYTSKSWEKLHYLNLHDSTPFKVIADEPYSNKVIVQTGGPYFFNGRWLELNVDTESPEIEFPISSFGRKDVVVIDSLDNSIKIIKGFDDSDNLPEIDTQYFPVAILNLPENTTSLVRGHYIEYIHPNKFLTSKDTALGLFEKLKTVDGDGSGIDLDLLGEKDSVWYKKQMNLIKLKKFWDATNFSEDTSGISGVVASNEAITVLKTASPRNVFYSSDGRNWAKSTVPDITTGNAYIEFGHGLFVVIHAGTLNKLWTTSDFISWNTITTPKNTSTNIYSIIIVNNRFFVLENGATTLITSNNGISWSLSTFPAAVSLRGIGYINNTYIAYQRPNVTSPTVYYTSSDGISWTSRTFPGTNFQNHFIINNKIFVTSIDSVQNVSVFSSTDGISWSTESINNYFDFSLYTTTHSSYTYYPKIYYYFGMMILYIGDSTLILSEDGQSIHIISIVDFLYNLSINNVEKPLTLFKNKLYCNLAASSGIGQNSIFVSDELFI